jgi:hypothetical protein
VELGQGDASSALFGTGVGVASGGIIFALSSGLVQAYSNYQFFKRFPTELTQTLNTLTLSDFEITDVSLISQSEVENKVKKLLKNHITRKTVQPGLISTLSISGGIFSLGVLFPPLFPLTSIASLGVLGIGVIATTLSTLYHRRKVNKLADEFFKNNTSFLDKKVQTLQQTDESNARIMHHTKSTKISDIILGTSFFASISEKAKYATPLIGVVAGGIQSGLGLLKAGYNAFTNYRDRQLRLKNLSGTIQEACDPKIFKKKYLFFGKSKLENYILEHEHKIRTNLNMPGAENLKSNNVDSIIKQLQNPGNEQYARKLINDCKKKEVVKNIKQYFKQKKIEIPPVDSENKFGLGLKNYIKDTIKKSVKQDVRTAGRINTLLVAGSIAALSIVMPPFAGFFLVAALGVAVIGLGITELVAHHEQRKFQKKINRVLASTNPKDNDNDKACRAYYKELATLRSDFVKSKPLEKILENPQVASQEEVLNSSKLAVSPVLFNEIHPKDKSVNNLSSSSTQEAPSTLTHPKQH